MEIQEGKGGVKMCVTGAGGYVGSWLVKNLLHRGYTVNATLRDPQNEEKTRPLLSLPGAGERLKLFQADLCEEHSFDSAVEGCQGVFDVASPMDFSKLSEFYFAAKTLAEQAAIEYGSKSGMEVLTIGPTTVCGPSLTSAFPVSCRLIIGVSPESSEFTQLGNFTQFKFESVSLVHIDDICEAHIFLMEQPNVEGRHICSAFTLGFPALANMIHKLHPYFSPPFEWDEEDDGIVSQKLSSKKLLDMGFSYKYTLEDIINQTIKSAQMYGILK